MQGHVRGVEAHLTRCADDAHHACTATELSWQVAFQCASDELPCSMLTAQRLRLNSDDAWLKWVAQCGAVELLSLCTLVKLWDH